MKKALIYYHESDLDGRLSGAICSRELRLLGYRVTLIGWDYPKNNNMPQNWEEVAEEYDKIFIVDISIPAILDNVNWRGKVVWIDHHKSAIERHPYNIRGLRIDGVAACRLCWQYFNNPDYDLLEAIDFVNRDVDEPELVALAGEYDVFHPREDDHHMAINFALSHLSIGEIFNVLDIAKDDFSEINPTSNIWGYVEAGHSILNFVKSMSLHAKGFRYKGLSSLFVNSSLPSSLIFSNDNRSRAVDFLGVFRMIEIGKVAVSVYRKNESSPLTAREIAEKHGGGGHNNAAGFIVSMQEFGKLFQSI
jgi:hypothetical protein